MLGVSSGEAVPAPSSQDTAILSSALLKSLCVFPSGCAESSLLLGLGFSLGAASRGYSLVKVHGLSCSAAACGIFPDQGSNWCPLHYKANS